MRSEEINLDKIVAEVGFKLAENFRSNDDAKKFENIVTKALSVLVEDGLFAFAVWLKSRGDIEQYGKKIIAACLELLKDRLQIIITEGSRDFIDIISDNISGSLEKTLLVKQLLERMLIYARYRAKAFQKR